MTYFCSMMKLLRNVWLMNMVAIGLMLLYLLVFLKDVESDVVLNLLLIKSTFSLVPIYLNNFLLVPFLERRKYFLYFIGFLVLVTIFAFLNVEAFGLLGKNYKITYAVLSIVTDIFLGMGVLFTYRYIIRNENQHRKEILQKTSELKYLKEQLDQHFLFNSLNTIYGLIKNDTILAEQVTERLSNILRYQLEKSGEDVLPLTQELQFLNDYLLIQESRFGERAHINFEINGNPKHKNIAPMLFIPFIENAFKHSNLEDKDAYIDIFIKIEKNIVRLTVNNSKKVLFKPKTSLKMGLKNIKSRLELLYPNHQLEIWETDTDFKINLIIVL